MPLPDGLDADAVEGVFVDLDGTVVHHAELLPTAIEAVSALQATGVALIDAASMELAVSAASELAQPGDAVLMSPACASFDMFDNYEHRARVFVQAASALADAAGVALEASL